MTLQRERMFAPRWLRGQSDERGVQMLRRLGTHIRRGWPILKNPIFRSAQTSCASVSESQYFFASRSR